jgi:VCBS repeat-containing protein
VLANDTDDDSAVTTLKAVLTAPPSHGTLVLNADGSFVYTPAKNFTGTDTFKYYALDVTPLSNANVAGTVTISVTKK